MTAGTRFSEAQLHRLQELLGISAEDVALTVAAYLSGLLVVHDQFVEGKSRLPTSRDVENAKRRLDRLAITTGIVADLLEGEPSAAVLLAGCDDEWPRASSERLNMLIADLRRVSSRASVVDDLGFRISHNLPPADKAGKGLHVSLLWPHLFQIWEDTGHHLAKTVDGPLHRFVSFVHEVAGIEKPSASTLRDAINDRLSCGSVARPLTNPPWATDA